MPAEVDPFLVDKDFDVPLDVRTGPQHIAELGRIAEEHPELQEGLEQEQDPGVPAAPSAVPDQPETFDVEGGTVTIQKTSKGWEAVLELEDGGGKETFKGANKSDLMKEVLVGKLNATKQIRKLNKKLKVGMPVEEPTAPAQVRQVEPKVLSADDVFAIKTELAADPDKALESWFQKKFGLSASELVDIARSANERSRKGEEAYQELTIEGVSKAFLEAHKDDYYPWEENGNLILSWLCKNKLRRQQKTTDSWSTIGPELLNKGLYTVANLEEAMEDLQDSGLLTPPPQPEAEEVEEVETVPATPVPPARQVQPAAPQNPRIVRQTRQPRGGLGIRPGVGSTPTPIEDRAPSVDELENLSNEQINELLQRTLRYRRDARR